MRKEGVPSTSLSRGEVKVTESIKYRRKREAKKGRNVDVKLDIKFKLWENITESGLIRSQTDFLWRATQEEPNENTYGRHQKNSSKIWRTPSKESSQDLTDAARRVIPRSDGCCQTIHRSGGESSVTIVVKEISESSIIFTITCSHM